MNDKWIDDNLRNAEEEFNKGEYRASIRTLQQITVYPHISELEQSKELTQEQKERFSQRYDFLYHLCCFFLVEQERFEIGRYIHRAITAKEKGDLARIESLTYQHFLELGRLIPQISKPSSNEIQTYLNLFEQIRKKFE